MGADLKARFRQRPVCDHRAPVGHRSTCSQPSRAIGTSRYDHSPSCYVVFRRGESYARFFWCLVRADLKARFHRHPVYNHRALLGCHSMSSQLSGALRCISIQPFSIALPSLLKGRVLCRVLFE